MGEEDCPVADLMVARVDITDGVTTATSGAAVDVGLKSPALGGTIMT